LGREFRYNYQGGEDEENTTLEGLFWKVEGFHRGCCLKKLKNIVSLLRGKRDLQQRRMGERERVIVSSHDLWVKVMNNIQGLTQWGAQKTQYFLKYEKANQ